MINRSKCTHQRLKIEVETLGWSQKAYPWHVPTVPKLSPITIFIRNAGRNLERSAPKDLSQQSFQSCWGMLKYYLKCHTVLLLLRGHTWEVAGQHPYSFIARSITHQLRSEKIPDLWTQGFYFRQKILFTYSELEVLTGVIVYQEWQGDNFPL